MGGMIHAKYSFATQEMEKIDNYNFSVVLVKLVTGKCAADQLNCV